ncbi:MAG TPA: hypothetical protein VMR45_01900 [Patescibacteria group bacterium]|nr:hypothetical protein [Patescibacteria group bacterium]
MRIKNKKVLNKKILILSIAILLCTVAIIALVWLKHNSSTKKITTADTKYVNLNPPTAEEQQSGNDKKKEIVENKDQNQVQNDTPAPGAAEVQITYAGIYQDKLEVGAYVSNVFEDGGTCKLIVKNNGTELTNTVTAVKDVKTTACPVMTLDKSQLTSGTWSATVTYTSLTHSGTSSAREIKI